MKSQRFIVMSLLLSLCVVANTGAATVATNTSEAVISIVDLLVEDMYYPGNEEYYDVTFKLNTWDSIWDEGQFNFAQSTHAEAFAEALFDTVSGRTFPNSDYTFSEESWDYGGRHYCYVPYGVDEDNNTIQVWMVTNSSSSGFQMYHLTAPPASGTYMFAVAESSNVPVPGTLWLFGSALFGMIGIRRKR